VSAVLVPGAQAAERPHFHACLDAAAGARCGYVRVPLDRSSPASPKIRIGFELYQRRDRSEPALGTLVVAPGLPVVLANEGDEPFEAVAAMRCGGLAQVGDERFAPPWAE
jgi:hypothetical protein